MPLRTLNDHFNPTVWCVASCCVGWVVCTISITVFAGLGLFICMYIFMMAPILLPFATMVVLFLVALALDYRDELREQATAVDRTLYYSTGHSEPLPRRRLNQLQREPPRIAMDQTAIDSIPKVIYVNQEKSSESMLCPICLTAYEDGEQLKRFPKCHHLYHPMCIDKWLRRNYTCPICRDSPWQNTWTRSQLVITVE